MMYCVVPQDVAPKARRSIERALRKESGISVVNDRRVGERRRRPDRRTERAHVEPWSEQRRIRYADGRRVAERRAALVPVAPPPALPRAARQEVDRLSFLEALDVPPTLREDVEAVRAIVRFQSGQGDVAELYGRWFDPIYTYLRITLDRGCDLERHVSSVLADALAELPRMAPGPMQLRPWLFGLAYRAAAGSHGFEVAPPGNGNGHHLDEGAAGEEEEAHLDWFTDDDLLLLIERRAPAERHLLVLRYFVGLSFTEVASVMGIEPREAVALHRAAIGSLDATLTAATRTPRLEGRHPMRRLMQQTPVLHRRRRALLAA